MGNRVVHFEVIGRDAKRLQSYYTELFGWEIDHNNSRGYGLVKPPDDGAIVSRGYGLVKPPDDGAIAGGIGGGHIPDYDGHVTFYVEVPDVAEALARAEELGGTPVFGPAEVIKGLVLGQFRDPEGHLIGLMQA